MCAFVEPVAVAYARATGFAGIRSLRTHVVVTPDTSGSHVRGVHACRMTSTQHMRAGVSARQVRPRKLVRGYVAPRETVRGPSAPCAEATPACEDLDGLRLPLEPVVVDCLGHFLGHPHELPSAARDEDNIVCPYCMGDVSDPARSSVCGGTGFLLAPDLWRTERRAHYRP